MIVTIHDSQSTAVIDSIGAQLVSLKDPAGKEYIWQRDKSFWPRSSPLLFPIVGNCRNNQLIIEGTPYQIDKHGFCRSVDFQISSRSDDQVTFTICDSEETRAVYPYAFRLSLSYRLRDGILIMDYQVDNSDNKTIRYCIGAHPGFNCPMNEGEVFEDYILEFEKAEHTSSMVYDMKQMGYDPLNRGIKLEQERRIPLDREMFCNDAVYFDQLESRKVSLLHKDSRKGIEVAFPGFETVAFWTPYPAKAPFVCIEPWNGSGVYTTEGDDLESKNHVQTLAEGESKCHRMEIKIIT